MGFSLLRSRTFFLRQLALTRSAVRMLSDRRIGEFSDTEHPAVPGTPHGSGGRPDPPGVPPSVAEAEIANPGSTGVRVFTNVEGDVVTVIPGGD